jgi:ribosome biogenesis GTPase
MGQFEEHFDDLQKKEDKKSKKIKNKKDVTFLKQQPFEQELFRQGTIVAIHYQNVEVQIEQKIVICKVRQSLKEAIKKEKNVLAVGDRVGVDPIEPVIVQVLPRKTILARSETLNRKKQQILAANVDQVFICCSIKEPQIKTTLIDRYLIACALGRLTPILLINKIDLADWQDPLLERIVQIYMDLGIKVVYCSAKTHENLKMLEQLMRDKISVFSGQSGVGKSSLINLLANVEQRTSEIVHHSQKGSHTTTTARLIPLHFGGFCVDTPGIKSFGIFDLEEREVQNYFVEIAEHRFECPFNNCMHINEKKCIIKELVQAKVIAAERYDSYCKLVEEMNTKHKRR